MHFYHSRALDSTKILTRPELAAVLTDLRRKSVRSKNTRLNLIIFRLAGCCGLRVSEIANLRINDVRVEVSRPHLRIRRSATKGGKARNVPLWWDGGTRDDLRALKKERIDRGASADDLFVKSPRVRTQRNGAALVEVTKDRLSRHTVRKRFKTACKILGTDRLQTLTIHHGRHTFISHALAGGRTLAEVRDAAGHCNVSITSSYLHVVVEENEAVGELFSIAQTPLDR
jgi:integrase